MARDGLLSGFRVKFRSGAEDRLGSWQINLCNFNGVGNSYGLRRNVLARCNAARHRPCTIPAVKDRVLGHNPLAAVYTLGSYYDRLR